MDVQPMSMLHEQRSVHPSPLKAPTWCNPSVKPKPSFRESNKDQMWTSESVCVLSQFLCKDDLTDPHVEGERKRELSRWWLLHSLRELWLMRCTAFSQANAREGGAINLRKRGRHGSMMHSDWHRTIFHCDRHYQWIINCFNIMILSGREGESKKRKI